MRKLILFDCDSTLSRIEGVDEMARLRGEDVYREEPYGVSPYFLLLTRSSS